MKREISGTSVATAVLLLAAGVLLCTKVQSLDAQAIELPPVAALLIESAFYAGVIYLWCGGFRLLAHLAGVPALVAIRIGISAAAAASAHLAAGQRPHIGWHFLSPGWESWMTAAAFAVIAFHLVRAIIAPARAAVERKEKSRAPAQPTAAKVAFESFASPTDTTQVGDAEAGARDEGGLQLLDARGPAPRRAAIANVPMVEGWVTVPASILAEQLPMDARVAEEEVLVPLALIMPRLREGEIRIPLIELADSVSLPAGFAGEAATVELPLPLVVPQLPDEALELPAAEPPSWLLAEETLEDIFFAKV